ncbi:MAG TPA: SGNH/GDSL hydrolase family protein [Actinocatenispora sp.]
MAPKQLTSYVAVGDSFTEGMDDPRGDGTYRGWADRVAEVLAVAHPGFRYANLAVRGRLFKAIVNEQVPTAITMRPDLISFVAGGNDALRAGFDLDKIGRRLDWVVSRLAGTGATVLLLTGADPTFLLPGQRVVRPRAEAYNAIIRDTAARHGAILVDLWPDQAFHDRRMWSVDRLHLSPVGHRRAAARVLTALGVPVEPEWLAELPPARPRPWLAGRSDDLRWAGRYFAPWIRRRLTGRSSGDGILPKRPSLDVLDQVERR